MRKIRQTTITVATLATLATGVLVLLAPAASSQTGYPPGPATTTTPTTAAPTPTTPRPAAVEPALVAQTLPPVAAPARVASSGAVAFTGANILRWSVIALVLVAVGSLFVVMNRRRRDRLAT